ncbi:hypothetical protein GP486_008506, partial [Trichoglossum hirsutum]
MVHEFEEVEALNENGKRPIQPASSQVPQHQEGTDASSRSPTSTTPENGLGPVQSLQQFRVEVPSVDQYPHAFDTQQTAPPIPWTFSFQETTFARRLHRAAVERGYYLLLSPNSPPSEVSRVFDFCFTFSDRNETLRRLREILMRSNRESLEYSQAPLLHIGGAGLRYPRKNTLGSLEKKAVASADLTTPVRSVGPMALAITGGMKEKGVTPEMMIELLGLSGEWFDSNDVEGYLREKGVVIAGDSSFADIEVEFLDTLDSTSTATPPSPIFSNSNSGDSASTNGRSSPSELSSYNHGSGDQGFRFSNDILFTDTADPFHANAIDNSGDWYFNPNLEKPLRHNSDGTYNLSDPRDLFGFGAYTRAGANATSTPHEPNASKVTSIKKRNSSSNSRRRKVVSIDVTVLVE